MSEKDRSLVRQHVQKRYGAIAQSPGAGCGCSSSCCPSPGIEQATPSAKLGYSPQELAAVPEGADMGLGCGNPQAIARLQPEETVLDVGSGGGFDCFLASRRVGPAGYVIGVDMTPEMIHKARQNAEKGGYGNVEFRLGEIEHLPVADSSVDVIISNCVINLSPDQPQVFREAYRVLKKGGRLAISDVLAVKEVPANIREDFEKYTGCVAGASRVEDVERYLQEAGFQTITIRLNEKSREFIKDWFPGTGVEAFVLAATIEARK